MDTFNLVKTRFLQMPLVNPLVFTMPLECTLLINKGNYEKHVPERHAPELPRACLSADLLHQ